MCQPSFTKGMFPAQHAVIKLFKHLIAVHFAISDFRFMWLDSLLQNLQTSKLKRSQLLIEYRQMILPRNQPLLVTLSMHSFSLLLFHILVISFLLASVIRQHAIPTQFLFFS